MADEIRADYAQLQQVSQQFAKQAQAISQMRQQVQRTMSALQPNWIGKGSEAFFNEMSDKVLPAADRLQKALQEAAKVTQQISQTVQQAEEQAAAPFRNDVA